MTGTTGVLEVELTLKTEHEQVVIDSVEGSSQVQQTQLTSI